MVEDGVLKRMLEILDGKQKRHQIVAPSRRVEEVLCEVHGNLEGDHLGRNKTQEKVRERFY